MTSCPVSLARRHRGRFGALRPARFLAASVYVARFTSKQRCLVVAVVVVVDVVVGVGIVVVVSGSGIVIVSIITVVFLK